MEYVIKIIRALSGLGAMLIGLRTVSSVLSRNADKYLQRILNKIDSPLSGVLVGAATTAMVQSSSVTTLMAMSMADTGLISLNLATFFIMGANVGTTVTGLIMGLSGTEFTSVFTIFTLVGVALSALGKGNRSAVVGEILSGLGLIFLGLEIMSDGLSFIADNTVITDFLIKTENMPLLLLAVGALITALVQSSTAVTGVTITMSGSGALPFLSGLYVILGANIGSCVTAMIASIGGGIGLKRGALINLVFNLLGTVVAFPILILLGDEISSALLSASHGSPRIATALFHVVFNVLSVIILAPVTSLQVRLAEILVPDKNNPSGFSS